MPLLSIIIPALNEEKYLPKLLGSIRAQSFTDYEIIVADAHSSDRTREIVRLFHGRVVDGGLPSVGRNAGARVARGKFFLFLDADVILPKRTMLARLVAEFERRKLDIATCLLRPLTKNVIDHALHAAYNIYTVAIQKLVPHIPGFFIFVRRTTHEKIGGFDETLDFAEDHEYARRAVRNGKAQFGFLLASLAYVSPRRFDRDGRLSIAVKYMLGELYLLKLGRVPPGTIAYGWGHGGKKNARGLKELKYLAHELWRNGKYLFAKQPNSRRDK